MPFQVGNGLINGSWPNEAKVTVARLYWHARDRHSMNVRAMTIQLCLTESIRPTGADSDQFSTQTISIECI